MHFEENVNIKKMGKKLGFLIGFFIFSSVFYLILRLFHKIPSSIAYSYIVIGICAIYVIGLTIKLIIKK